MKQNVLYIYDMKRERERERENSFHFFPPPPSPSRITRSRVGDPLTIFTPVSRPINALGKAWRLQTKCHGPRGNSHPQYWQLRSTFCSLLAAQPYQRQVFSTDLPRQANPARRPRKRRYPAILRTDSTN